MQFGTVCAQSTTPSKCGYPNVCYSLKQDIKCLESFKINENLNLLIDQQIQMLEASFYKNEELQEDNSKLESKIKKKNKTIINWITATVLAVVVVIVK